MSLKEKILFGTLETTSYLLIGSAIYFGNIWLALVGGCLLGLTLAWFSKLAKQVGLRISFKWFRHQT